MPRSSFPVGNRRRLDRADNGINPKATNAANSGMSRRRKIHIIWTQPHIDAKKIKKTAKVNKKIRLIIAEASTEWVLLPFDV